MDNYDDIINLERPISKRHGKMPDSVMHKNATAVVIVAYDRDQLRIFPHLSMIGCNEYSRVKSIRQDQEHAK